MNFIVTTHFQRVVRALLLFVLFLGASSVYGGIQFNQGWWNVELTGGVGLDITTIDRADDLLFTVLAEYEFPVSTQITVGLGCIPILWYVPHSGRSETVWGGGLGLAGRYYFADHQERGAYATLKGYGTILDHYIVGNTSKINFLIGTGVGYRFLNNWHVAVTFEHVSNGGLGSRNQSFNSLGLTIGYNFGSTHSGPNPGFARNPIGRK